MMKRKMKCALAALLCMVARSAVFLIGRYGWKLFGFKACESAGIEEVSVAEDQVHIKGFYPGSLPTGFLGYHVEQVDDTLYVGFRFSGLFGIFETGDFDLVIPTNGSIRQVIIKTGDTEYPVWSVTDSAD